MKVTSCHLESVGVHVRAAVAESLPLFCVSAVFEKKRWECIASFSLLLCAEYNRTIYGFLQSQ